MNSYILVISAHFLSKSVDSPDKEHIWTQSSFNFSTVSQPSRYSFCHKSLLIGLVQSSFCSYKNLFFCFFFSISFLVQLCFHVTIPDQEAESANQNSIPTSPPFNSAAPEILWLGQEVGLKLGVSCFFCRPPIAQPQALQLHRVYQYSLLETSTCFLCLSPSYQVRRTHIKNQHSFSFAQVK